MLEPFLKWPGGKRWLVSHYPTLFPSSCERYLEPFLGGGAVFFFLQPRRAILADKNAELINAYTSIKRFHEGIDRGLRALHRTHSSTVYYRIRRSTPRGRLKQALRFLYLNRTCFNGIYRVNYQGIFNVPMGSKTIVEYPGGYLSSVAHALSGASIRVADFTATLALAKQGDFVFVDPPYTVAHNTNNFLKYNSKLFSWPDQIRLAECVRNAAQRGARVMISNADHRSIRDLYGTFGFHYRLSRSSVLAANSAHRRSTTELLITNYRLPVCKGAEPLDH